MFRDELTLKHTDVSKRLHQKEDVQVNLLKSSTDSFMPWWQSSANENTNVVDFENCIRVLYFL